MQLKKQIRSQMSQFVMWNIQALQIVQAGQRFFVDGTDPIVSHCQSTEMTLSLKCVRIQTGQTVVTQITYYQRWVELQVGFYPFQTGIVYSHWFDVGIQSDGHIWQVDIGAIDY
jgi:hypothetical protein